MNMYTTAPISPYGSRYGLGYRPWGLGSPSTQQMIQDAAGKYNVPSWLALAVAKRESNLNQAARGTSGEVGVFQLMPGTASDLGVDPSDLSQNVDGGVRYLGQLYSRFGNWFQALEAYNGGQGNVQRGTVSSAAQQYANAIVGQAPADSAIASPSGLDQLTLLPPDLGQPDSDGSQSGLSLLAIGALALGAAALVWAVS